MTSGVITNYTGVVDVLRVEAAGQKTWVGYLVDVEPDGTNPMNADHTFTVTVDRTDGTASTDAAGVTVNLSWNPGTATGSTINQVNLPGVIAPGGLTATCVTNASGVCTVTVRDGDVPGTGTLTVTSVEGDLVGVGVRAEAPIPGSDVTGTKTWVDHRVIVTPTDTNAVGQPHTFSVLAQINNGTEWVNLTAGTVDLTWNPGSATGSTITNVVTGTIAPSGLTATCDLAAANPCQVTVNSLTDFGTGTLTATTLHATVGVPGDFPVINADNNASKTWVQFQTSVAATETNLTGEPHTFTITAQYVDDSGAPDAQPVPNGTVVNFNFAGTGSVTHVNGAPAPGATSCVTTGGTCTVTVSSSAPGSGTITVTGIESVVIDGDELAPGAVVLSSTVIPGGSQTAVKTWALYAVDVSDDATNLLGDDHVFTISVTRDTGSGPVAASGVTVNYTWAGPAGSTASPTTACVTGVSGTCTVTVDSDTTTGAGTLTVTSLGTSEGPIAFSYADGTTGTPQAANGLNTATSDGRGVKQWWAFDVDISADDANLAGQSHTFTVTARVDRGDGLGLVPVENGAHVTATTTNNGGNGAIVGTGDAGALTTCLTSPGTGDGTEDGTCTIVVDGTLPGATTVTLTSLLADGFTIDLTSANTDGIGLSTEFDGPAASTKYWVQYRVTVTPNADENPLTVEHVFTITVETTIDGTTWVPAVAGTLVDYNWTGPVGSTEDPADTCTLGAAGTCTVTVDSNTNPGLGTLTVTGIRNSSVVTPDGTLVVPNADLTAAGALYVAAASDLDGTKIWAGYKVIVTDDGRNPRNHEHDFTVTLYKTTNAALYAAAAGLTDETTPAFDPTGWTVVNGASLGLAWSGDGQITSIVTGTVNSGGLTGTCITTCTVTVNNPTDGFGTLTVTSVNGPQQEAIPAFQNDDATKEWVGFNVDITGDATNPAGDEHEFVVTVEVIDGVTGTAAPAPDGTIVGFTVLPAATVVQPGTTCDNGTVGGECSIVIVAGAAGTHTVTVTSLTFLPGNDVIDEPLNTPISLTIDEQASADKTFRQYRITTEDDATNLSGEDHTFTFTVEYTENGTTWNPLADSTVQFAADDPSAVIDIDPAGPSALTCVTDALGQCDVTVTSADTGSVTVSVVSITDTLPTGLPAPDDTETVTLPVTDTTAVISTDSATKTWIAFDVDITPSTDTNRIDDDHTFTITVRVDPGTGTLVAHTGGGSVSWSFAGPEGPQTGTCTLNAGGTCTVTLNSGTPGTGTLTATSLTATFNGESFGPISLTVAADGQAPGLTVPPTAQKTWIEILANVEASEINLAGDDHVFTLTAFYDDGTGSLKPANGASFDFSWSGPVGTLVSPAASPCVAAPASNTCLVTVSSDVGASGTITIDSVTVTVNGVTFTDEVPVAAQGDSLTAVKTWIAYLVDVTPAEADNLTGDDHIMFVSVQADIGGGFLPLEGATVTFTFPGAGGTGTVIDGATETPPGSGTYQCVTVDPAPLGDPACEITVSSSVAGTGTLTVTQIASPPIGGLPVPIANVTADAVFIDDDSVTSGSKTWQEFRVDVEADGTNPLGQEHPFTITVTRNLGDGIFVPVGGVTVTYNWVGPAGSTISPNATTCTTSAGGTCALVVDSDVNPGLGRLTVTQLSTLPDGLPPIDLTYASVLTQTPDPADGLAADSDGRAVKVWAQHRVVITPLADSNLTGQSHTFTLTAQSRTEAGEWAVDSGVGKIVFRWNGPAGSSPVGATALAIPGEFECVTIAGVCQITIESSVPGTGTITALRVNDVLIDGVVTATILVLPEQATKTWVEYRVDVSADAVNLLGEQHEFTITVEQNSGSGFAAAAGVTVAYSWTGPAGSTFVPASPCVTDAGGHCVVTVDSDTTTGNGTLQIDALSDLSHNGIDLSDIDLTYSGGTDTPDATDGLATGSDGQGVKSWIDFRITVTPEQATNEIDDAHTFTVLLERNTGSGFAPLAGETVAISGSGTGAITAIVTGTVGSGTSGSCTTNAGGTCAVTVNSGVPGSFTVTASYNAVVAEASKTVTDSGVKTWIFPPNADLAIVKNASVATAERGGTFNWILDTVNNGPGPAINAVVSDTVPAPFIVTGVSGTAGWACSNAGNAVTCTKAFVAVGETAQFTIAVSTPADAPAGTITNTGAVQATTPDPNLANNSDDASVQIPAIVVQPPPPPVLPRTGASAVTTLLQTAALLLAVGFVVWGISRRRTADDAS